LELKGDKIVENILNVKCKGKYRSVKESRKCEQQIRKDVTQREGRKSDETEKALWKAVNSGVFLIFRRITEK